jgi:phosphatidylinositol alpha-mannosyltransferase
LLAEAFEQHVLPHLPDAQLWMVAEDAPARPGVRPLGRVSADELADLYRRAWVFSLPSTYEGFGIPYIEAMASGTPIVATPNAGAVEVTAGGRFGLLVDESELGGAVQRLVESPDERQRMAEAALGHVRRFDIRTVAATYEKIYLRVFAGHA